MEFFLPSLAALLLVSLLVFFVFPRFGAPVLVILSLLLLSYGLYNHMKMFSAEYRLSTWQEQAKLYAPFILIGVLLLTIVSYLGFLFMSKGSEALPAPNVPETPPLPPANTATNVVTEAINNTLKTTNKVTNTVNSALNTLANQVNKAIVEPVTNAVNQVTDIENIQSLLATPKNKVNANMRNNKGLF